VHLQLQVQSLLQKHFSLPESIIAAAAAGYILVISTFIFIP
jgi:hypothetical protein